MSRSLRPSERQHTVTKRVLKEFVDQRGNLAVFDEKNGTRQIRTPSSGVFTTKFDSYDSVASESRWNLLERRFPRALGQVHARAALGNPETVATLKDLLALHWARSVAIMVARERVLDQVVTDHKRDLIANRPQLLERALLDDLGLVASTKSELQWMNDRAHDRAVEANLSMWNSHRDPENFAAARTHFERFHIQLGHATGHDLVISDCPVISTRGDRSGTGPHQGIAIKEADHIAMPISPGVILGLGPRPAVLELSNDVVDFYNRLQWMAHETWVAARPDGPGDMTLKVAASSRRP